MRTLIEKKHNLSDKLRNNRRSIKQYLCVFILLFCSTLYKPFTLVAQEGTKQLMPTAADILYLELFGDGHNFASYGVAERERLNIYLKAGEKMHFGMRMQGGASGGNPALTTFRIKDPTDNVVFPQTVFPTAGTGYISNHARAVAGPNGAILNGTTITTGYTPFIYTATSTGDHYIEFQTWTNTSFTTPLRTQTRLQFFDVTVTNAANNIVTNPGAPTKSAGRLWSKQIGMTTLSFTANAVQSDFFIYTADGFVNKVNFEMLPFGFVFISNSFGTNRTADALVNRKSIGGNAFENDVAEHKIFFNDPDQSVFLSSTISPSLKIQLNNTLIYDYNQNRVPQVLPLSPGVIQINTNDVNCPHTSWAYFSIESNAEGQLQILLDIDGGGFTPAGIDKALYTYIKSGINYLPWDLKDGLGNIHQTGALFNAQVILLLAGTTHFPLYDVETLNGITAEIIRPFPRANPTIFWDDTQVDNPPQSTLTVSPMSANAQLNTPSTTPRIWAYNSLVNDPNNGNLNTMNSWFSGLELVGNLQYAVSQAPLCENEDNDQDGKANLIDIDDDNDGIPDLTECPGGIDPSGDEDNDGLWNYLDSNLTGFKDLNGDGVNDNFDRDLDAVPDHFDLDSDNDGIMDVIEAGGADPDLNGIIAGITITDIDLDGLEDSVDPDVYGGVAGIPLPNPDTDKDSIPNAEDLDSDNDGIPDNREGQATTTYIAPLPNADIDKDGLNDAYDNFYNQYTTTAPFQSYGSAIVGGTPLVPVNTDNTDQVDYLEADSDNDSARDWVEGFDDNENGTSLEDFNSRASLYETANGNPGHYPNTDANANNIPDWLDDSDTDNVPNFLDPDNPLYRDTDQDGLVNLYDNNNNGKGYGSATVTFSEPDNDNDAAPNYRDVQQAICLAPPLNATVQIQSLSGTSTCTGGSLTFTAITANGGTNPTYIWTINNVPTGATGANFTASNLKDGDEIRVTLIPDFPCGQPVTSAPVRITITSGPDLNIEAETTEGVLGCVLTIRVSGANNYTWSPTTGIESLSVSGNRITVSPTVSTTYIVRGFDGSGCFAVDSIRITILPKEELFVPSLFTPNNDSKNDRFLVHGECIKEIDLKVFDRAGNLVYQALTVEQATLIGWDGTHNGKDQPSGKYLWRLEGKCANGLELEYQGKKSGTINLFR